MVGNGLCALLGTAGNVLIMGHRFGDFDSFGSAVGVACLVRSRGVPYRIVVNRSDPNIQECFDRMENLPEYADVFVSGTDALDYVKPDTLLILVDVNNYDHVESPALIHAVKNIVIIDHHNQTGEFRKEPLIAYIEPSASSASELVGEILEQHLGSARRLMKEEAEMMLSGILLDTKRFTRSTGTRTFGVALYLRGEGANPAQTNEMFKSDVGELTKESQFLSKVLMYKEHIALAVCDGDMDSSYRVVAAKAADRLLSVKEVHASFALVKIGDRVHISARSDGTVNVQVVLEQLNGGGHFDVAGAQVEDTMHSVVARLKKAIDAFVE